MNLFIFIFIIFIVPIIYFTYPYILARISNKPSQLYIKSIHIYPIKSCAGISVPTTTLNRIGLENDRNWMLINVPKPLSNSNENKDDSNNNLATFHSQRKFPKMALLQPSLEIENKRVIVSTDGAESIEFPMYPSNSDTYIEEVLLFDEKIKVRVYKDETVNHWFSEYFQTPTRLATVLSVEDHIRPLPSEYDPNEHSKRIMPGLNDVSPLLIASTASIDDLNTRITHRTVPMKAFRPNIVISSANNTLKPWAEDEWTHLEVKSTVDNVSHMLYLVKNCARCAMPNVIPDFGIRDALNEPGKTLHAFRERDPNRPEEIYFGVHGVQAQSHGSFKVGDTVIPSGKRKTFGEYPTKEYDK
jgi:uncharacterized protein YcbX